MIFWLVRDPRGAPAASALEEEEEERSLIKDLQRRGLAETINSSSLSGGCHWLVPQVPCSPQLLLIF